MAVVVIHEGAIKRFATGPEVRALMTRAGDNAHRSIQGEMSKHVKTGAYMRGLQRPVVDGRCVVTIRNTDKKAAWLELGTSPHTITGRPFLYWPGARHPVRSVQHPGTKAYRCMTIGLQSASLV